VLATRKTSSEEDLLELGIMRLVAYCLVAKVTADACSLVRNQIPHASSSIIQEPACSLSNSLLFNTFALKMNRINKDVTRCERNYLFFTYAHNLLKLKKIDYTYALTASVLDNQSTPANLLLCFRYTW